QERGNPFVHKSPSQFGSLGSVRIRIGLPPRADGQSRFESKPVRFPLTWLSCSFIIGFWMVPNRTRISVAPRRDLRSPSDAISSVVPARDPQLPHLGIQGSSLQPETRRTPLRPADDALGLAQDTEDVLAVCRLQA